MGSLYLVTHRPELRPPLCGRVRGLCTLRPGWVSSQPVAGLCPSSPVGWDGWSISQSFRDQAGAGLTGGQPEGHVGRCLRGTCL